MHGRCSANDVFAWGQNHKYAFALCSKSVEMQQVDVGDHVGESVGDHVGEHVGETVV